MRPHEALGRESLLYRRHGRHLCLASGKDGAAGTRADPLRSIPAALAAAARNARARLYVCEGIFDTQVTIAQPIAIYGGLTCSWAVKPDAKPTISPSRGVAFSIASVTGEVALTDLNIAAISDPATAGGSAIGMFISESKNVTLRQVTITAAYAQPGSKPTTLPNYNEPTASKGSNAMGALGGAETTCTCLDGKTSSRGGAGGSANNGVTATTGTAVPAVGADNGGFSSTNSCPAGPDGANGVATAAGVGATVPGRISKTGWEAFTTATAGGTGNPGQGGGGGGSMAATNFGGAGGGCGGCGGRGGAPGTNGGSSIALLSFDSVVLVIDGAVTSAAGGDAGTGGDGQDGQTGGPQGASACTGGAAGFGAGGSGGGGGAGGHSIAVAFRGLEPRLTRTTTKVGARGKGAAGGAPGHGGGNEGSEGAKGSDGVAQLTLALP